LLKKILVFILAVSLICSVSVLNFISLAADHPTWEVVQDYENADDTVYSTQGNDGPLDVKELVSGNEAIYGNKSLKITTNLVNSNWNADIIEDNPAPPTIENPSGFFFRIETNNPKDVTMIPMFDALDWNDDFASSLILVSDSGTVIHENNKISVENFCGYIFVPVTNMSDTRIKKMGFLLSSWNSPEVSCNWGKSYLLIDNAGYYSVTDLNADSEYVAIVNELNENYEMNPPVISSISTGTYLAEVLADAPTQLQMVGLHLTGKTILWSIDNTNIATVDANGFLTPKKLGKATVTASIEGMDNSSVSLEIKVVKGCIYLTLEDNTDVSDAVTEAEGIYGIKPKVNAGVFYNGVDNSVIWSVVNGSATIEDLDVDVENASANTLHSCYVTFEDSGTIVIRAALKDNPSVYRDITFTVSPNSNKLLEKILEAQSIGGTFDEDNYNNLLNAISEAEELLSDPNATQSQYNSAIASIQATIDNLYKNNPDTDDIIWTFLVLFAFCSVTALVVAHKKVFNR